MGLTDLTIQAIIFRILALLVIAGVQGAVIAAAAVLLGDRGPRYDGRLTVMPTRHIDPIGAMTMVLWGYGWAKPVAIDARQFRIGRVGILLVVLAGFVALLLLAAILSAMVLPALTTLPHAAALTMAAFLRVASSLSIWFALLSLVPVPPLTGGLLLGAFGVRVSSQARWILTGLLVVAVATGFVRQLLGPAHAVLASIILGR